MGGYCPGGFCPGGILSGGYCPGDIVRGDIVRGDIVLIPPPIPDKQCFLSNNLFLPYNQQRTFKANLNI